MAFGAARTQDVGTIPLRRQRPPRPRGDPDVLDFHRTPQKGIAGRKLRRPVDGPAAARPDALQIADRLGLRLAAGLGVGDHPQPVDIVVPGQNPGEFGAAAGHDVDRAGRQSQDSITDRIGGEQRIFLAGHRHHRIAHGQAGATIDRKRAAALRRETTPIHRPPARAAPASPRAPGAGEHDPRTCRPCRRRRTGARPKAPPPRPPPWRRRRSAKPAAPNRPPGQGVRQIVENLTAVEARRLRPALWTRAAVTASRISLRLPRPTSPATSPLRSGTGSEIVAAG